MGSKAFLFLGICLALLFMISSEVVARELAETDSLKSDNKNEVPVDGRSGYNGIGGDGHGGYYGGGGKGKGGGEGYCRYGCCKKGYKGCRKCCSYAGEAVDEATEATPHN